MIARLLLIPLLLFLSAFPARTQDAFDTPITGEILAGWQRPDGTRMAAIRLTLASGWKTYWRAPGDGGIPPEFDWSKSVNLRGTQLHWPTPTIFQQAGMQSYGYEGELILPITLIPRRSGRAMNIEVSIDMGVCREICIPHQMELSAIIDDANMTPNANIAAALAARPYSAQEAGVGATQCQLRPNGSGLEIEVRVNLPSTGGKEVVVLEPGQNGLWVGQMTSSRSGKTLVATGDLVSEQGGSIFLDRSAVTITVLGQRRTVEIVGCTAAD
ncbi:MAG: protein-disulfide reductase DsbD domain-containing protein [Pseudomonadota bacterium]